jgi:small-conductance mechanosensitive channel
VRRSPVGIDDPGPHRAGVDAAGHGEIVKRLTVAEKILTVVLGVLLIAAGAAWWKTAPATSQARKKAVAAVTSTDLVDQSSYATAQRLALQARSDDEQSLAQSALRIADHELDLAFTAALRDVEAHPPALNSNAAVIQGRIAKSQALLDADQQHVTQLTGALAQAKAAQKDALQDELDLAQSQLELDKDELDEANQDLVDAGGNPRQQIEIMVQEHDASTKAHPAAAKTAVPEPGVLGNGSLGKFKAWRLIKQKQQELDDAQAAANQKAEALGARRAALASSLNSTKGGISALSQHAKTAAPGPSGAGAPSTAAQGTAAQSAAASGAAAPRSHEDAATLLGQTKSISADQKILTMLDRRIADQHQLAHAYQQWSALVASQAQGLEHELLLNVLIIIVIALALLFLDQWLQHLLDNPKLDRRQVETLRSITRAALRVVGVLIILLIIIGMPSQFGTMIGIVGAGLTVALKDFIVAFFGWLVLMGRNGIRLGDWVEINGVSGEVTELGMFHTVLLETGNWSDSGHPTGRRVTFTNSFAIEGHYFNFSTSGQWLWDELQVVVPAGSDPYPIVDAITKQVGEITAESARQAEQEWQRAVPAGRAKTFSGQPGVNVKPVVGGVEISVRYITRANERFLLRAKLYQSAVDLLGAKPAK